MPVQNMLLGCTFFGDHTVQVLDCHLEQVWGRISFFVSLILLNYFGFFPFHLEKF
jgi:hypothetical protein